MEKLSERDLRVLTFLSKCENGITVSDCWRLFGTTECRKIISKLRKAGYPIADKTESYRDSNGTVHRYKRYRLES